MTELLNSGRKAYWCNSLGIQDFIVDTNVRNQEHMRKRDYDVHNALFSKQKTFSREFVPVKVAFKYKDNWNYFYLEPETKKEDYIVPFASGTTVHYDYEHMEQKVINIIKNFVSGNPND